MIGRVGYRVAIDTNVAPAFPQVVQKIFSLSQAARSVGIRRIASEVYHFSDSSIQLRALGSFSRLGFENGTARFYLRIYIWFVYKCLRLSGKISGTNVKGQSTVSTSGEKPPAHTAHNYAPGLLSKRNGRVVPRGDLYLC